MADERKTVKVDGETLGEAADRTGMFTSGVVSTKDGNKIALFFSGRRHAGENLADILRRRREGLETPIQMCGAPGQAWERGKQCRATLAETFH